MIQTKASSWLELPFGLAHRNVRDGKPGGEWPRLCEVLFEKNRDSQVLFLIF